MKTYVYWNLHKNVWSKMVRGKVVGHQESVYMLNAEFRVRPGGHARVLAEQRKNVHAFCIGTEIAAPVCELEGYWKDIGFAEVSYNPYKGASFYCKETGKPVVRANLAVMLSSRKVFASNVR